MLLRSGDLPPNLIAPTAAGLPRTGWRAHDRAAGWPASLGWGTPGFAELKTPVRHRIERHRIERYELTETIDPDHLFETIRKAVDAFGEQTGASWTEGPGPCAQR